MKGATIGGGDGQRAVIGASDILDPHPGYGARPSLPTYLRGPVDGPVHEGEYMMGSSRPLTLSDALLVNAHHGYVTAATKLPESEANAGVFMSSVDNEALRRWIIEPPSTGFKVLLNALRMGTGEHSGYGIGAGDIQAAFSDPGPDGFRLLGVLRGWAQTRPLVRRTLDDVIAQWKEGQP